MTPRHHTGAMWSGKRTDSDTKVWFEPKFMTSENYESCRDFLVRAAIRAKELGGSVLMVYSGETENATLKKLLSRTADAKKRPRSKT